MIKRIKDGEKKKQQHKEQGKRTHKVNEITGLKAGKKTERKN